VGNAGGLISIYGELRGWESSQALQKVRAIFETMKRVFEFAHAEDIDPATAADRMAEACLREAREARIARSRV
jgi:leucine dehydrogenase